MVDEVSEGLQLLPLGLASLELDEEVKTWQDGHSVQTLAARR